MHGLTEVELTTFNNERPLRRCGILLIQQQWLRHKHCRPLILTWFRLMNGDLFVLLHGSSHCTQLLTAITDCLPVTISLRPENGFCSQNYWKTEEITCRRTLILYNLFNSIYLEWIYLVLPCQWGDVRQWCALAPNPELTASNCRIFKIRLVFDSLIK